MKKTLFLFSVILLFACKSENSAPIQNKSKSNISLKGDLTTLNSTFFKHYSYIENEKRKTHILEIKQQESFKKDDEFTHSELEISSTNKDWKIENEAHNIDFKNNTIFLEHIADFDHENTYSAYNIETGKHLLDYTYGNLTARIPSSNFKRYIGFVARSNSKNLLKEYDEDVLGILTYASDQKTLKQILISSKSEIGKSTPSMEMVALSDSEQLYEDNQLLYFMDLKPVFDSKDINFAFGLKFYLGELAEESAILFDVKEDKISLKDAKYDPSVFQIELK